MTKSSYSYFLLVTINIYAKNCTVKNWNANLYIYVFKCDEISLLENESKVQFFFLLNACILFVN